jgi:hypothetical protein
MATSKTVITPRGVANYPWVSKADSKFGKEEYKIGLILDAQGAEKLQTVLKEIREEEFGSKSKEVKMPLKKQQDGTWLLRAKSTRKPVLVNIKGETINSEVKLGGGSAVKLDVTFKSYDGNFGKGVSCYLNQVQIIKLVEYQAASKFASAEDELEDGEEGFVAAGESSFEDASNEADASSGNDASEF